MVTALTGISMAVLHNGNVLVAGGAAGGCCVPIETTTAQIYRPASGTFAATNPLNVARYAATAVTLADGRVLVIAGRTYDFSRSEVEIYNPATNTFQLTGSLNTARFWPGASCCRTER